MTRKIALLPLLPLLASCQSVYDGTQRVGDNIGENYVSVSNQISDMFLVDTSEKLPIAVEVEPAYEPRYDSSYCYKSATGPVCFNRPQRGEEERLVGYQHPITAEMVESGPVMTTPASGSQSPSFAEQIVTHDEAQPKETVTAAPRSLMPPM